MRKVPCAVLLLLLLPAARSEAAPITFDFTVNFTTGDLAGESFQGSLSVDGDDCPGGICVGAFFPDDVGATLLSLDITVDGLAFDITDDVLYPSFPVVTFDAGNLTGINYLTDPLVTPFLGIGLLGVSSTVTFVNAAGERSTGTVNTSAVPEPASLSLLGLSLAGLGVRRWRQRKAA